MSHNELSPEQRRAWLAEHFGLCYTSDGRPAYQSERTANDDALFVDADGKERKLSDVANKNDAKWIAATNAAIIVNYNEQFMSRRKDELEDLACRTAYTILSSMPADLRQTWLAARNRFFFLPDMKNPYGGPDNWTLESGVKHAVWGGVGWNYNKCLYYDPIGKMVHPAGVPPEWGRRWSLLYYCESLLGIEAINSFFSDEVNAMRTHFEKSPFRKK